jgi:hypothetical protein
MPLNAEMLSEALKHSGNNKYISVAQAARADGDHG